MRVSVNGEWDSGQSSFELANARFFTLSDVYCFDART
jgi:hypothetical protein